MKKIWISFGCQNLGEFLEIYLESDVLMLTDIFENFRNECLKNFHIDTVNFDSTPSLSYHAMLLLSKVVFEPIPNLETYYFLLRAKRGGLSQVTTRYAKVKNTKSKALQKYFNDPEFDENAMTTSLYYIDCNQLYPTAMLYKLPVCGYKFISTDGKGQIWIANIDAEENKNYIPKDNMPARAQGDIGYIIEIDFHYHEETHKRNNDLPPGPETMKPDKISPFNASHYVGEISTKKLIAHLGEHNNFVCHCMEAQEIIRQGGVITKIHKILQVRQEAFAREYVILNNNRRKEYPAQSGASGASVDLCVHL